MKRARKLPQSWLINNNRLTSFQKDFLSVLKNLYGWFSAIQEDGLDIETDQEYFYQAQTSQYLHN